LYESVTKVDKFQLFLLNLVCKVCFPNARCALTDLRTIQKERFRYKQRKLDIPGARSAQSLESAKFEEITKKNARWA
jgi:hypothetical protein